MPKRLSLQLSPEAEQELQDMRDHHPQAYMRERAAALLKIAAGQSPYSVAQTGLLKTRDPDTVYTWLKRYSAEGAEGLHIKAGRGRKPAFSP